MNYFWTADLHIYHANIIKYCNRPWLKKGDLVRDEDSRGGRWISDDVAALRANEMTEDLIDNWNSVVSAGDVVYLLGDFGFVKSVEQTEEIIERLNGKITLYKGNHDSGRVTKAKGFAAVQQSEIVKVYGVRIFNCHYPSASWEGAEDGVWHCYGHKHGTWKDDPTLLSVDVGVDCHNYTPISFEQLAGLMAKKEPNLSIHFPEVELPW